MTINFFSKLGHSKHIGSNSNSLDVIGGDNILSFTAKTEIPVMANPSLLCIVVKLAGGGCAINGATQSSFLRQRSFKFMFLEN